jgi:hypothetical protein
VQDYQLPLFPTAAQDELNPLNEFFEDDTIRQYGRRVSYSRLNDLDDIDDFRDFLAYVQSHPRSFAPTEVDAARLADKPYFRDVRISDRARRILGLVYHKAYGKQWRFNFVRGYRYSYKGQAVWGWANDPDA